MKTIAIMKFPIINGAEVNSVNARDIHTELKVKTKFADWIKRAIDKYDFKEGADYAVLKNGNGNNATIDYIVTIDMAKELSMLENNPKGKEYRKYFINFEDEARGVMKSQAQEIAIMQKMLDTLSTQDTRITQLEQTKRLESWQERELQDAKNRKVYEIADGDEELVRGLHRRVWHLFKKKYNLPRYNELPSVKFNDGINYINGLRMVDMVV